MNMKMRKNFALLAVLAVAVFVASAGLVSSAENTRYLGGDCFCGNDKKTAEDKYGADIDSGSECNSFCSGVTGVTSNPDTPSPDVTGAIDVDLSSDKIRSLSDQVRGSADEYCDGPNCVMKGKIVTGEEGAKFVAESNYEDSLDMNGNKFTCTSQAVGGQGSGEGSAAQASSGSENEDGEKSYMDSSGMASCYDSNTGQKMGEVKCGGFNTRDDLTYDECLSACANKFGSAATPRKPGSGPVVDPDQDNGGFLSNVFNNNADN